ncbi:hypothetical protein [Natrinema versiforme]|uniref:Uncharacterized protein n=1 Tax=Natrinema versiforme TaxID=88724 RepID=A0A4P8WN77_9EURY|nr:hypothetical protein [Natrinema versiforme]QCS45077.1 hypothetical protein FEJ81_22775 [Natrinema versiforme]
MEPATSVQSAIVKGIALFIAVVVVFRAFQGEDFLGNWILAFGPSFAFTVNLFLPVMAGPGAFIFSLVSAVIISSVITVVGYPIERDFSVIWGEQDA